MNQEMSPLKGSFISILYLLITSMFFLLTSMGWSTALLGFYVAIFGMGIIIFVVLSAILLSSRGVHKVVFSKNLLIITMGFLVIALLFNHGDCGDNPGSFFFYERLVTDLSDLCSGEYATVEQLSLSAAIIGIYSLSLIIFLLSAVIASFKKS